MKIQLFSTALLSSVILISCKESSTQIVTLHSPDFKTPIVSGLRITSANGPEVLAIWRDPYDTEQYNGPELGSSMPRTAYLGHPYPNPANGSMDINFALPYSSAISCWIVPATLPENSQSENTRQYGGMLLPAPIGYAVDVLIYNVTYSAGLHRFVWPSDSLPAGFYRIYLQVKETLFWRDVLLYRKPGDIPPDLLKTLPNNFPLFFNSN